ncbi:hypothetical protein F4780DRAFT_76546 [Xylariomycetidae sp. FL0641]|nr:hypothetical protein F4780DRAFT_76546 [Xylariomycetidae sp. FL0641]
MSLLRMLCICLAIPVASFIFLAARFQYHLVKSTYTRNALSPTDPIFSTTVYGELFGHRTWAKIESFAVGVVIPLNALRSDLKENDRAFAAEVMRVLWNRRVRTQSNGPPWASPPQVGAVSSSDAIRAEVVEVTPMNMALKITTVSTGFTGGMEAIEVHLDHQANVALVSIKYVWHNDVVLPRKWKQYLGIWMQLTSRRMWLLETVDGVTTDASNRETEPGAPSTPSAKAEL